MSVRIYSLFDQTEGGKKTFFWECKEEVAAWDYPQEYLVLKRDEKSLSFCEIQNNLTPPLLFIRPLYK